MCIISFYKQNDEVILTHNRDEVITREASLEVEERVWNNKRYFAPIDQLKQGTWIFYSEDYIACILNGGKDKPISLQPSYQKSRGIVLLNMIQYNSVKDFVENEDLIRIAPFTIFVFERKSNKTYLLFWNEKELELNDLSNSNFVFRASSTLYSFEKMRDLEKKFPTFNTITPEEIFILHQAIKMKDGDIAKDKATTSITQIVANDLEISMKYCPI